jgi:hypothetical protein
MAMTEMGYQPYEMRHVKTGVSLYRTTATPQEISEANRRLISTESLTRFFPITPTRD